MSKQTLSALTNHGQTNIHTSPNKSNPESQSQGKSSTLNALIFQHSMGGINIASALPKQTHGTTNITGRQNAQPIKINANKAKLTPFEAKLLAQAKAAADKKAAQDRAEAAHKASVAAAQAKIAAEKKAAQERAEAAHKAAMAAAQAKAAAEKKAAQERAQAAHKAAMAAAQEKAAAAKKAAQEKAYALHKAAMAAAEKKALEAKKAAQEKAEAERKAAREKAEADRIALEQKHEFDRKAAIITAREKAEAARKAADAAVKAELAEKKRAEQIKHSENKSGNHSSSDEETGSPVKNKVSKTGNLSSDKPHTDKVTDLSDDNNNAVCQQNNKSVSTAQPAAEKGTTETVHIHHPAEGKQSESGDYKVYESKQYGRYINVNDFGADPTGKKDSLAAIKAALEAAHKEKAMLFMDGTYYISDQIVIDSNTSGVKGIFGAGMGKTQINFDKAQVGVFNSNTNHDDVRAFAGILVDGQNGKTIADLSVRYTNADFYRKGLSYFGKVNGILVNDADNTLISKVEVSGANRAGVTFTSTAALMREAGYKLSYKDRVANGSIDDKYDSLPLGENNRIVDSNLHHNRVAGALVSYQKNFLGEGNLLSWNGHQDDGGTGYGIAAAAGSYNYGITYRKNTTDHNYRKGLDVHDGTDVLIENNTLNGDRLYGIAVYNRQFSLDNVKISGNVITQDTSFRLAVDDTPGYDYHMYSGIQIQTNTQRRDLHTKDKGYFDISNNTINNLEVYKDNIQTYGIEFRNHEQKMDYTLNITGNKISGESTKYLMAVINDTYAPQIKEKGIGTSTINISDNVADIGKIKNGAVPFYIEEHHSDVPMHGSVTLNNNAVTVREESGGYAEFAFMRTNAKEYNVTNNTLSLHGHLDNGIVEVRSTGDGKVNANLNMANNTLVTDIKGQIYKTWLRYESDIDVYANSNTHNGDTLDNVNTKGSNVSMSDVLVSVSKNINTIQDTVYSYQHKTLPVTEDHVHTNGIL